MLQLEQERGLPQLTDRWMSVAALQTAMVNAGLNVFVNEHSEKYTSVCAKVCVTVLSLRCKIHIYLLRFSFSSSSLQDPLTERAAYEQMALFASACAFSWSKWNASCGSEHVVMQVSRVPQTQQLVVF